jgi:hypothetical protein
MQGSQSVNKDWDLIPIVLNEIHWNILIVKNVKLQYYAPQNWK